jgi:hypothetical protein
VDKIRKNVEQFPNHIPNGRGFLAFRDEVASLDNMHAQTPTESALQIHGSSLQYHIFSAII